MEQYRCGLEGACKNSKPVRKLCCWSCAKRKSCRRQCANHPGRCGVAKPVELPEEGAEK